jgi:hypothetical protein
MINRTRTEPATENIAFHQPKERKKRLRNSPTLFREAGSLIADKTLEDSPGTINRATAKEGNSWLNLSIKIPHYTRKYYSKIDQYVR